MRYLSLCSGIEAASVAWDPLGWTPAAFAEIEAFPSAVLKAHYPDTPNLGDITRFKEWPDLGTIDLVCGGTPCQSFSVAGLRQGLADPRGNLMLTYLAIIGRYRPRWCVWENVPGVLSSNGGNDFASFLFGLGQLGYGWAYRVLDAQYVRVDGFPRAVPQRRRRVWVVGCAGDWASAAAVLSERQSLLGDSAPRREARQRPAPTVGGCSNGGGANGPGRSADDADGLITVGSPSGFGGYSEGGGTLRQNGGDYGGGSESLIATALDGISGAISSKWSKGTGGPAGDEAYNLIAHTLRGEGFDGSEDGCGRGVPLVSHSLNASMTSGATEDGTGRGVPLVAETLVSNGDAHSGYRDDAGLVAFNARMDPVHGDVSGALDTDGSTQAVMTLAVRGRGDGCDLEVRDDGAANALLTPSGGRAGIGVGAIAFDTYNQSIADQTQTLCGVQGTQSIPAVAFTASEQANGFAWESEVWQTLDAQVPNDSSNIQRGIRSGWQVRRLTPTECERLMGFPDGYTAVTYRGKLAADGPRYRALGNSWAVNCARWIGRRIEMVEAMAADE